MDVYQDAVDYLDSGHIADPDILDEYASSVHSPLQTESMDFPEAPECCIPEEPMERRLLVLKGFLESEELYLRELEALLMPMKALWASAGTSQPVLSSQQVHTVFYQVPELRDMHQTFYSALKARLSPHCSTERASLGEDSSLESKSGEKAETRHSGFELMVGDVFLKMMSHIGVYGGFIQNYEEAVAVVRKCTQADPRFRTLAQSMMLNSGPDKARTTYTFEALLYKPLDRLTKTTLVLHDLVKTTPEEHKDYTALQEALRLSRSFLAGVNERSHCKWEVTLSHGMRRQLMRDGFVVDTCEGHRNLRHVFLYTDLLLCTKFKAATKGRQDQYRFCWFLPLAGLKLHWFADQERPPDIQLRLYTIKTKLYLLRQQLQQHEKVGSRSSVLRHRSRKKMEQLELMLLTYSPVYRLELHSPSDKSHCLLFSSLYELEEWRDAIYKLTTDTIETIPPDLLTLTGACAKLRMTQQPPLQTTNTGEDKESLCGTLSVAIHSACGLQQPACVYVCVEADGYEFHDKQAQTHSSVLSMNPHWDQELNLQVDGAQNLRVLCVGQYDGQEDTVLGKVSTQLDCQTLTNRWRRQTLHLGQVDVNLSIKYCPHPLAPPSHTPQQQPPVFGVPIGTVAQQEGVLVPHVVRCCVEEVERRGMDEVGIYRVSGVASDINTLKSAFNNNLREAVTKLRSAGVNVVAGVLKLYFRELPEPLIPAELFQNLSRTLDSQDLNSRLVSVVSLLQDIPAPNRNTFLYLLHHLQRVSERQHINKMSLINLATVFGPSLVRPPVVQSGLSVNISQEVIVQVQVVFFYLQCNNLPEAQTSLSHDSDDDEDTTHV
ncbi:breakpoint cluster region protein isoform X2 [Thalassophryne amazonica]|uniref:breakpoint cluster region protein isoform X2 n=1 Tax=Thalassophryne amazonica TaxID=390379 RepID=UPI001470E2E9|nr:breakpoint cluster region protein isoform X2 [Thalassophryne amazonica]